MTPDQLRTELGANLASLPGTSAVREARQTALADFARNGFPSRKLEAWRYTNIAPIADGDFVLFATPRPADETIAESLLREAGVGSEAAVLLFVDGRLVANQTRGWRASAPLEILTLAESLDRHGPFARTTDIRGWPLAALNIAFVRDGAHLRLAVDAQPPRPLHIVLASVARQPHAIQPQLIFELARGAALDVVVHLLGHAQSTSWTNLLTNIDLAENARLQINRRQHYSEGCLHTELASASIGRDAVFRWTSVDLGGRLVRNDLNVRLDAPGASCDLAGLTAAASGQHVDNHISVEHLASYTESTQQYRAIVGDRGRSVFNGKVVVHDGTKGISAMQSSDNLLLAKSGEIDTKPELEIHADDVKCAHGATVGELDESQLFYLRTRGLAESAARGLLTLAFAEQILERVEVSSLGSAVAAKFGLALPDDEPWSSVP